MRHATIRISKNDEAVINDAAASFVSAWNTGRSEGDVFTFSSPAQLFSILTPKRWALLEKLQATGASSLRSLARALERDVKRVHDDVAMLIEWGLIKRDAKGKILVPFDVIHADFDISAAA